jgi:hypothetical protein
MRINKVYCVILYNNPHYPQYPHLPKNPVFTRVLRGAGLAFFSGCGTMLLQLKKSEKGTGAIYESRQYL